MSSKNLRRQLISAAFLSGFLFVAMAVLHETRIFSVLDHAASAALVSVRNDQVTRSLVFLTEIFNIPFMILFLGGMLALLFLSDRRLALRLALASFFGVALFTLFKLVVHAARPEGGLIDVPGFGFPSGHATIATVLFVFFAEYFGRMSKKPFPCLLFNLAALCMIIIVGLSRMYLGLHWLSDVLAGMLLGAFSTSMAHIAVERCVPHSPAGKG